MEGRDASAMTRAKKEQQGPSMALYLRIMPWVPGIMMYDHVPTYEVVELLSGSVERRIADDLTAPRNN